jgi:hypothetical protein
MNNDIVNLDEGLAEYFEYQLGGFVYRVRYPTVEETDRIRSTAVNEDETRELLFKLITPIDSAAPAMSEVVKKMPVNKWNKFLNLIMERMGRA